MVPYLVTNKYTSDFGFACMFSDLFYQWKYDLCDEKISRNDTLSYADSKP